MSTTTKNRRRQRRHAVSTENLARVEFHYPAPSGKKYVVSLVDVSASGLSFALEEHEELRRMEEGTSLPGAVVRVGDCRIHGELLAMHVTADPGSGYVCGALFYPATDTDLVMLKSVIAGMEVAGTD